jgi:flavin reductase (DIM6/NTAB) family NADH-FMN oxidoreductase RutF
MSMHIPSVRAEVGDQRELRNALGRFATGVAVITTRTFSGEVDGLTVNSFSAVSLDPPLILWSLRRSAHSFDRFFNADRFAVNILSAEQQLLCQHFARPGRKKFDGVAYEFGQCGCPVF